MAKSEIIPIGEVEKVEEMVVELGSRVGQLLAVYFGLPLGAPNKAISGWDGVEEKLRRRLALSKRQYISKDGRITLIKSTMAKHVSVSNVPLSNAQLCGKETRKTAKRFFVGGETGKESSSCQMGGGV